jgi:hypothetical protein
VKARSLKIVADGFGRLCGAKGREEERARLLAEARRLRGDELARASFWRRVRVNREIGREVRAKLEKKFPRWALYAGPGRL